MRYLYKGVILTKYNLARRQCQRDRKCCFCSSNESIQHLLFYCHFAKFIWRIVHVFFNLLPPTSVHNLFTGWLDGIDRKLKSQILVGESAICWTIWLTQNDIVFDKVPAPSYTSYLHGDLLARFRSLLQKEDDSQMMNRQSRWRCLQDTVGDLAI